MARVLVTTFSHLASAPLDAFRESFVDALVNEGNEVLLMRTEDFMERHFFTNDLRGDVDRGSLNDEVGAFSPEAVISFNHSGVYATLPDLADCPIGVWLVDGPAYLVDKDVFRERAGRLHSFVPARWMEAELGSAYGVPASAVSWLPFCTDFRAEPVEQTVPISFVGTYFYRVQLPEKVWRHHGRGSAWPRVKALIDSYREDVATPFAERLTRFRLEHVFDDPFDEAGILNTLSLNRRLHVLDRLTDLGLEIYGNRDWLDALPYSIDLVLAFQPEPVVARSELEALYNRSKIAISVSHVQARGGLPWRVFDAMASNCVLVSDQLADLAELFPGLALPTYDTPESAREVCRELLQDEGRRAGLAAASRQAIEAGHRFRHRLHQMGEALGVDLLPGRPETGTLKRLDRREFRVGSAAEPGGAAEAEADWPLRVWYSDSEEFLDRNSIRSVCRVKPGADIDVVVRVPEAPGLLRVGLGEFFSVHRNPALSIRPLAAGAAGAPEGEAVALDLGEGTLNVRQCHFAAGQAGSSLVCGNHPYVVVGNPFPGRDVEVRFTSRLERML